MRSARVTSRRQINEALTVSRALRRALGKHGLCSLTLTGWVGPASVGWVHHNERCKVMLHSARSLAAVAAAAGVLAILPTSHSAQARGDVVAFDGGYSAGTVVVKTNERRLYFVMGDGRAIRYPVGVGKAGKQWAGTSRIDGKYIKPAWAP